ncbi:MAG: hypothetical protein Q9160_002724 [Pyrenula sp. 1 TL-2023]
MAEDGSKGGGMDDDQGTDGTHTPALNEFGKNPHSEPVLSDSDNGHSESEIQQTLPSLDIEDVIGVSIGKSQNHMRSPQTPAIEKTQALEQSEDYFVDALEVNETSPGAGQNVLDPDGPELSNIRNHEGAGRIVPLAYATAQMSRTGDEDEVSKRSDTGRSILRDTLATSRKRASSGSKVIAESLGRLIPDMSTIPWLTDVQTRQSTRSIKWAAMDRPDRRLSAPRRKESLSAPSAGASTDDDQTKAHTDKKNLAQRTQEAHHSASSALYPEFAQGTSRPLSLRRSTSDNSLFLRRQNTSSTSESGQLDHVHEQVNSRFKAIRDSLQDSGFRMPKFPNLSLGPFGPPSPHKNEIDASSPKSTARLVREPLMGASRNLPYQGQVTRTTDAAVSSGQMIGHDEPQKSSHPILADALSDLHGDVIVLGGYRGSVLRSAAPPYRQLWVPVKVGLNIRRVDLEVGLSTKDEEEMDKSIAPSGVLSHIGPVDICRRLLRKLKKCSNARNGKLRVHDYGYDWRLSPHILSRKLIEFLETLQCNQPGGSKKQGAVVIAHSLGGLIARHAVNRRPELFAGVLYAGGPLRNGDSVLLSSKVLTAQVNFTIRTSFLLLPESGICFFDKSTKERYDVDFFDVCTWATYRLSPCISPPLLSKSQDKSASIIEVVSNTVSSSLESLSLPTVRLPWTSGGPSSQVATHTSESKFVDAAKSVKKETAQFTQAGSSPPISLEPAIDDRKTTRLPTTATTCTIPRSEAVQYLQRTLADTRRFKQELACKDELRTKNKYPPAAILYSRSTPTVSGARVAGREEIKYCDAYDDLAFGAGDGVVLARAAMPPEGYRIVKNGLVKSERGHVGLLGDLESVGTCLRALIDGRSRGVGLGEEGSN